MAGWFAILVGLRFEWRSVKFVLHRVGLEGGLSSTLKPSKASDLVFDALRAELSKSPVYGICCNPIPMSPFPRTVRIVCAD